MGFISANSRAPSMLRVCGVSGAATTTKSASGNASCSFEDGKARSARSESRAAGMRHRPDAHVERAHKPRRFAPDCAETDEQKHLPAQFARLHRRGPQFVLSPPRLLLVAQAIGKAPGQRDEHSENVLRDRNAVDGGGVRDDHAPLAQFGIHELRHARGYGMNPFELGRECEQVCGQRIAHENIGVGEFLFEPVEIRQMHDAHFREASAHARRRIRRRIPERKGILHADEQLCFGRRADDCGCVISLPLHAQIAARHFRGFGEIEDAEKRWRNIAQRAAAVATAGAPSSVIRMKGTGFVV